MVVLSYPLLFAAAVSAKCYERATAHPLPDLQSNDPTLKNAFATIETALLAAVASPKFDSTSFSIDITSSKETLWSQHHTARQRNASRPDIPEVNGDALYRIASITKTFTTLAILYEHEAGHLSLDDPVNKYITQLNEKQKGTLPWKDITLRTLASQLSGIPREFAQGDLINHQSGERRPVDVGLPPVSRDGLIACDEYSHNYELPCTAHDLLHVVKSQRPVFAPNIQPTYSNVAFELLGLVIERVTNKTYASYIEEAILNPLQMSKSTLSTPSDSAGVIPLQPHYWDVDAGIQSPTGAIFSSAKDLSKYLRYILTHYNAIATGVNWFLTGSSSEGLDSFYGMPWETFQTDQVLKDSRRKIRFVTKSGSLPGYTSVIIMLPEYGIGVSILVAGNGELLSDIREVVSKTLVRAAEAVAVSQLKQQHAGTYTSNNKKLNSTITLVADKRGLVIEEFISNGTDVLQNGLRHESDAWYAQLVPTLLYIDEKEQKGEIWRVMVAEERLETDSIWDDFCFFDIDQPLYAMVGFNELVFWDKQDEKYGTLELSAFRANLTRSVEKEETWLDLEQEIMEL